MTEYDAIFLGELRFLGVSESAISASAGSVRQGCAVQFGMMHEQSRVAPGFHAFASPEIVAACEWVCRRWDAEGGWTEVDLPTLQAATGLDRSWAADLLVVVDASDNLGAALATKAKPQ